MIDGEPDDVDTSLSAKGHPRSDRKILWLIPGAHKTGSTTVQNIFDNNASVLKKFGIQYVDREEFYKSELRKYLVQDHGIDRATTRQRAEESLLSLTEYSGKSGTSMIFIENVFGEPLYGIRSQPRWTPKIYPDFESSSEKFFGIADRHFDIRCLYFIRRQDTFLESLYTHFVYRGFVSSELDFLPLLIGTDLSWVRNVDTLKAMAVGGHVGIVPFELLRRGIDVYLKYLFTKLEIVTDLSEWNLGARENRSLSKAGMEIARAVHSHMGAEERKRFVAQVRRHFNTGTGDRYSMFNPAMRRGLIQQYYSQNRLLLESAALDEELLREYDGAE